MSLDGHKWSEIANIPRPRLYFSSALVDEKIFLFGGCEQLGKTVPSVESYNFGSQQWQSVKNMPVSKAAPTVHRFEEKVFLFGGVGPDAKATDSIEYLDLGAEEWVSVKSLPEKLQGIAVQRRGDKLILVGGMTPDMNGTFYMYCFDPTRATLQPFPAMPTKRAKTGAFFIDDKLYVLGGADGRVPTNVVEMFDFRAFRWTELARRKTPARVFESYVAMGDSRLACVGGLKSDISSGFSDALDIYDIEADTWTVGAPMPDARGDFASCWYRDRIVAAGGFGNQGKPSDSACAYDPENDSWTTLPSMKEAHASCGCVSDDSRVFVIGGMSLTSGYSPCVEVLSSQ